MWLILGVAALSMTNWEGSHALGCIRTMDHEDIVVGSEAVLLKEKLGHADESIAS